MTAVGQPAGVGVLRSGSRRSPARVLPAALLAAAVLLVAVVAVVLLTGQQHRPSPRGLADAGAGVAWVLAGSRALGRLAVVGTVGTLLVLAWLASDAEAADLRRLRSAARAWAATWALASAVLVVATGTQLLGIEPHRLLSEAEVWTYLPQLAEGRVLMAVSVLAVLTGAVLRALPTRTGAVLALGVAVLGTVPQALTGHAASAGSHYLATQASLLHVLGAVLWCGGLVGLLHLRGTTALATAAERFSRLAVVAFVVVAVSGLLGAWVRLGPASPAWRSTYAALVAAKVVLLVLLGAAGWWHRRRTLARLRHGDPRAFRALAAAEGLVMVVALAVAVVLARTPAPVRSDVVPAPHPGPRTVPTGLPAPSVPALLGRAVPDAVLVTLLVGAAACLLLLVRLARRSGRPTGAGRAALGLLVLAWALVGGLGAYGSALLAAHLTQLLICLLVVPPMLLPALEPVLAPVLARTGTRALPGGVDLALATAVLLGLLSATPVLGLALRSAWAHDLVLAAALLLGLLLASARRRSPGAAAPTGLVLVGLAGALVLTPGLPAAGWFRDLALPWADADADRAWSVAVLAVAGAVVLLEARGRRSQTVAASRASTACR